MASPRLGWASRSLMRAHREKPLGRAVGTVSLRTVPLQEGAGPKPNFTHPRGRPSTASTLKAAFVPPGMVPMGWAALPGKGTSPAAVLRGLTDVSCSTELVAPQNIHPVQAQRCCSTGAAGMGWLFNHPAHLSPLHVGQRWSKMRQASHPGKPGFMSTFQAPHSFLSHSSANVFPAAPGGGIGDAACPGCAPLGTPTCICHRASVPSVPCSTAGPSRKSAGLKKYQHV